MQIQYHVNLELSWVKPVFYLQMEWRKRIDQVPIVAQ